MFSAARPFWHVSPFLENHSIFSHENVYRCSWYYSDGQSTFFDIMTIFAGGHFSVFLGLFFHVSLFLESCAIFYHGIVYRCAWYYSDGHFTKKMFCSPLLTDILGYFGAHVSNVPLFPENIQYFIMNFCRYY